MNYLSEVLEKNYSITDLQKIATRLDKIYRLNFFWNGWVELEKELFNRNIVDIQYLKSNYSYKDIYNHIIMKYGKTERVIKYYLSKQFINNDNEVGLYEFSIGNSRLDFGRINGKSYAYEIKTELDSLIRLKDQIDDYEKVFEFINVVVHEKHFKKIKSLLPRNVGIIVYDFNNDKVKFDCIREAKENINYKKRVQIEALNSADLKFIIKDYIGISTVPQFKNDRLKVVDRNLKKREFNIAFKEAIKHRKYNNWRQVKDNFNLLYPIEIQDVYTNIYKLNQLLD